jgi:hypothetical protein
MTQGDSMETSPVQETQEARDQEAARGSDVHSAEEAPCYPPNGNKKPPPELSWSVCRFAKHAFYFRKGKCEGELTHTSAAVSADVSPDGSYRGS